MNTNSRESGTHAQTADIHVAWRSDRKAWLVTRSTGQPVASMALAFRMRAHAIAFARAVAASRDAELVVNDTNGKVTRHAKESLTYPTRLD